MASEKLIKAAAGPEEDLHMNMSPMIDLVFLLLIFFMVNSTLIIVRIDKEVKIPTADQAKVAKDAQGRIVINIRENGDFFDVNHERLEDEDAVMEYVRERKSPKRSREAEEPAARARRQGSGCEGDQEGRPGSGARRGNRCYLFLIRNGQIGQPREDPR